MRITGGTFRGRTITAPDGLDTRPTSDRVRQALFNILMHHEWGDEIGNAIDGKVVLDAFAGTGALGIEALSQGAVRAYFFEKDRKALEALNTNIAALKLQKTTNVMPIDIKRAPVAKEPAALVFFDPPYRKGLTEAALQTLSTQGWIAPHALLVCETAKGEALSLPANCTHHLTRTYGDTDVHFWEWG